MKPEEVRLGEKEGNKMRRGVGRKTGEERT